MKILKKTVGLLCSLLLILGVNTMAFAENIEYNLDEDCCYQDIIERVYTPCTGGNGICQMARRGNGTIYNCDTDTLVLTNGRCWQCKNCNTVIITQGDPVSGDSIGIYAIWGCDYVVSNYGVYLYSDSQHIGYTTSHSMTGYRFYYAY